MSEDKVIVESILNGDREAFARIVEKYERLLQSIIYQMVQDTDLTKDLCQEALIKCYKKLKTYDSRYSFKYWLIRIAKNHVIDYTRKSGPSASIDDIPAANYSHEPKDTAVQKEKQSNIEQAMSHLSEEDRMILYMKYHEGFKNPEIAESLDIPDKHIRIKVFRAKKRLRKIMENMEYFNNYNYGE
ncbi:MAG: RNA polymerase sigma factor [candidate division WOR-3 bacterium]|nr:RNA polymerase sigma factor [candidate division WOR-3 bacterium]